MDLLAVVVTVVFKRSLCNDDDDAELEVFWLESLVADV